MPTAANVSDKLRQGLKPQAFIERMTKNKEAFLDWQQQFTWPSEEDKAYFESVGNRDDLRCLILAADWCGDVIRNVPAVLQAMETTGMPIELFIMEEHTDLMDEFLTMGGRAIPVVVIADTGGFVLGKWGPRPKHVQEVMTAFKLSNPDREAADYQEKLAETRKAMMERYGEGPGYQHAIVRELRELLESI